MRAERVTNNRPDWRPRRTGPGESLPNRGDGPDLLGRFLGGMANAVWWAVSLGAWVVVCITSLLKDKPRKNG